MYQKFSKISGKSASKSTNIQKNKDVYLFLKYYLSAAHMIGGLGMKAHDGMTSVPEHQRSGGIQLAVAETEHAFNMAKR